MPQDTKTMYKFKRLNQIVCKEEVYFSLSSLISNFPERRVQATLYEFVESLLCKYLLSILFYVIWPEVHVPIGDKDTAFYNVMSAFQRKT